MEELVEVEMLTKKESNAINSLNRLAKRWPNTLMLFSHSGTLCVMKQHPHHPDDEHGRIVEVILGIQNDGGDPNHKHWNDD